MKIIFCVFLSLVMILGCMSGCANTPSENTTVLSTNSTEMPTTPTESAGSELSEEEKAAKAKAEVLSAEAQAIYDSYKDCPVYWCGEDSADTLAEGQKAIWVQELPDKSPNSKIRAIYIYYPCAFDPSTMDDNALKENEALRVFGYIGIPNTDGKTLPGMIYVHGAGGHASASCVEEMMNRGFAGISLDTEGYSNITGPNNFSNIESSFRVDPLGHKSKDNYDCEQEPLQNQWMYWAVGDTILANTVMHSLECLDSVSLIGISYGGVVSLTVTCFDQRYDCVVPIYASFGWEYHVGFDEQNVAEKPVARYLWQNREMLAESTVPTLIYCSDDDLFFFCQL